MSYNQRGAAAAQSQTVRPMSARGWREILVCATVLAVTLRPFPALANIGLPMVAVFLPPAWFALIPIIIIESAYGVWRFRMAASPTYAAVETANCISTLIGLPITWVVLALGQLLLFGWLPEFSMAHRFVGRDRTERALAGRHGDGAHGSIRFEAISLSSDQVGQELSGGSGFREPLRATGFNNACFLYGALMQAGPWGVFAHHVTNSSLVYAMLVQCLLAGWELLNGREDSNAFFDFCLLVPVVTLINKDIAGYTTDLPTTLTLLQAMSVLYCFLTSRDSSSMVSALSRGEYHGAGYAGGVFQIWQHSLCRRRVGACDGLVATAFAGNGLFEVETRSFGSARNRRTRTVVGRSRNRIEWIPHVSRRSGSDARGLARPAGACARRIRPDRSFHARNGNAPWFDSRP